VTGNVTENPATYKRRVRATDSCQPMAEAMPGRDELELSLYASLRWRTAVTRTALVSSSIR